MRDVGDELVAHLLRALERVGHVVEGRRQRGQLVGALLLRDADGEVAVGEFARGRGHLVQRLGQALGGDKLMMRASESTASDTMKNTQIKVCHAPMMRELSVLMNT